MSVFYLPKNFARLTPKGIPPGMLSSPQIKVYLNHGLLLDKINPHCLGSAAYNMRLGHFIGIFDETKRVELLLGKTKDKLRGIDSEFTIHPNQLVFVTTIEKFLLTKDVVARFNLKSKLVHKGLLLGTGPIVDPEFHGRILIPIHNFSNSYVTLNYGQEIISVEFTKTLTAKKGYIRNKSRIGSPEEYFRKMTPAESSVYKGLKEASILEESTREALKKIERYSVYGGLVLGVTILALFAAMLGLMFSTFSYNPGMERQILSIDAELRRSVYELRLRLEEQQKVLDARSDKHSAPQIANPSPPAVEKPKDRHD